MGMAKVISMLDNVSTSLESKGFIKEAYILDAVSNTIEAGVGTYKRLNEVRPLIDKVFNIINKAHPGPYEEGESLGGFKYEEFYVDVITREGRGSAVASMVGHPINPKVKALVVYKDKEGNLIGDITDRNSPFYNSIIAHEMSHLVSMAKNPQAIDLDMRNEIHIKKYEETYLENTDELNSNYIGFVNTELSKAKDWDSLLRKFEDDFMRAHDLSKGSILYKKFVKRLFDDFVSGDLSDGGKLNKFPERSEESTKRRDEALGKWYTKIKHKHKSPDVPTLKKFLDDGTYPDGWDPDDGVKRAMYLIWCVVNYKKNGEVRGWVTMVPDKETLKDLPRLSEVLAVVRGPMGVELNCDDFEPPYRDIYPYIKQYIGVEAPIKWFNKPSRLL